MASLAEKLTDLDLIDQLKSAKLFLPDARQARQGKFSHIRLILFVILAKAAIADVPGVSAGRGPPCREGHVGPFHGVVIGRFREVVKIQTIVEIAGDGRGRHHSANRFQEMFEFDVRHEATR
jgi:hypothetical protein